MQCQLSARTQHEVTLEKGKIGARQESLHLGHILVGSTWEPLLRVQRHLKESPDAFLNHSNTCCLVKSRKAKRENNLSQSCFQGHHESLCYDKDSALNKNKKTQNDNIVSLYALACLIIVFLYPTSKRLFWCGWFIKLSVEGRSVNICN